jgi:hypothetical protein
VEIIVKKMWHRGDRITGRDIFDFALIAQVMVRHAGAVLTHLDERYEPLKKQFDAIETLNFHPTFDHACAQLRQMLPAMLAIFEAAKDDASATPVPAKSRRRLSHRLE